MSKAVEREKYLEECLQKWRKSGQRLKPWCKKNRLPYPSLWYRNQKHMSVPHKGSSVPSLFSELAEDVNISQSSGVEIHIGAISIHLCKNFDTDTLMTCITVLQKEKS